MTKYLLMLALLSFLVPCYALPNPASVNCEKKGGKLKLLKSMGICIFPDKSYCEEWQFFRKECKPGQHYLPKKSAGEKYYIQRSDENTAITTGSCKDK